MKIKVSVIVPVYNVEKFIDKCLNSLVNQTLKEIEIIVVNDGSPDNSQKIIDKYVKKYPEKVQSFIKENGGQGSARNLGIEKAKGEYISFVDSDDWLDLDALEKMYSLAKKDNSDIVICDMVDHYANYTIYHNCTKYNSVFEVTPSACNKIFKKELIKDFRFLSKLWYEDFNFTTKILFNTDKISNISEFLYPASKPFAVLKSLFIILFIMFFIGNLLFNKLFSKFILLILSKVVLYFSITLFLTILSCTLSLIIYVFILNN
jgi:glycosyltransferase involved in cell wall biosynthesis